MRQMSFKSSLIALACAALAATACKKDEPKPAEPPKTEEAKPAPVAAAPAPAEATPAGAPGEASPAAAPAGVSPTAAAGLDAATVLLPGVQFMFDIDASPGARAAVLADCIAKAGSDSAKMQACPCRSEQSRRQRGHPL